MGDIPRLISAYVHNYDAYVRALGGAAHEKSIKGRYTARSLYRQRSTRRVDQIAGDAPSIRVSFLE